MRTQRIRNGECGKCGAWLDDHVGWLEDDAKKIVCPRDVKQPAT